ncbi:hypothetical protein Tco_1369205 [Tanacetum coccineum]
MKPKEPTYQVVLDALALATCYPAFLITAEVLVIYMHQFWATVNKHNASYRFKIDNKWFSENVEVFREILNICPRIPEIKYITDVIVDHLHQPWRTFASIINKCLCGKVFGLDKIQLSRVQILWRTYYKKNLDFVALIWEDLAYQIDNKDSKKQDKMFYPRFTKIIIHHFLQKDKSILMRNRMFMHTAQDDSLLRTMRFVSRHKDTQVYGTILPKAMTNQAMLDSIAYKTFYAIASGAEPSKPKKSQKKSHSTISSEESLSKKKHAKAKKDATSIKKPATKPKPTKKKEPFMADRGKGDGTDFESGFPDEQQRKTSSTDEGTSTKPGVPDVPKYDSKSEKESWGDSGEEYDDDEDDFEEESDDDKGDDGDDDDNNDDSDDKRTKSDIDEILDPNQTNEEQAEEEAEYDDERVHTPKDHELIDEEKIDDEDKMDKEENDDVTKELYKDVNVNLGNEDADMTHDD